ncbi:hypothetical protein DFH27DRAFT_651949 [Peziza echinospora]|nr:hypothetical protein DFH27DRAFT_651949 [Peziza echinospora]
MTAALGVRRRWLLHWDEKGENDCLIGRQVEMTAALGTRGRGTGGRDTCAPEDRRPPPRLQALAAAIYTSLKNTNRSDSEQKLFSEAVGILDHIPDQKRVSLFSDRSTRSTSTGPSLSRSDIEAFGRLRTSFFNGPDQARRASQSISPKPSKSLSLKDSRTTKVYSTPSISPLTPVPTSPSDEGSPEINLSLDIPTTTEQQALIVHGSRQSKIFLHSSGLDSVQEGPEDNEDQNETPNTTPVQPMIALMSTAPKQPPDKSSSAIVQPPKARPLFPTSTTAAVSTSAPSMSFGKNATIATPKPPGSFPQQTPAVAPNHTFGDSFAQLQLPGQISSSVSLPTYTADCKKVDKTTATEHIPVVTNPPQPPAHHMKKPQMPTESSATKSLKAKQPRRTTPGPSTTISPEENAPQNSKQVEDMTPEEMKELLEQMLAPLRADIADLKTKSSSQPPASADAETRRAIRQAEIANQQTALNEELAQITAGTWVDRPREDRSRGDRDEHHREDSHSQTSRRSHMPTDGSQRPQFRTRFDPSYLPKFREGDDLDNWISEMSIDVTTFREALVCPIIFRHCFEPGSPMREWYLMLSPGIVQLITEHEGCWKRFVLKMRKTWDRLLSTRQRMADERTKLSSESFATYYFTKLKLLTAAYPECEDVTLISRIRAGFNDSEADLYIRERTSLLRFINECRQYDEHLKAHPKRSKFNYPAAPQSNRLSTQKTDAQINCVPSLQPQAEEPAMRQRKDTRVDTLADRFNPVTKKSEKSFLRKDGTVVFLDRPCGICEKLSHKNERHFSFERPLRSSIKTMLMETLSDDETELPGPSVFLILERVRQFGKRNGDLVEALASPGQDHKTSISLLRHGAEGKLSHKKSSSISSEISHTWHTLPNLLTTIDVECDPSRAGTNESIGHDLVHYIHNPDIKRDPLRAGTTESADVEIAEKIISNVKCDPTGAGTIELVTKNPLLDVDTNYNPGGIGKTVETPPTKFELPDVNCDPIRVGTTESKILWTLDDGSQWLKSEPPARLIGLPDKSFLRTSPLFAFARLGHGMTRVKALQDVCSNASLIDADLLKELHPEIIPNLDSVNISGIGSGFTSGFCTIPLWIEGSTDGTKCLIKFDVDFHVVESFGGKVLLGIDALLKYNVELFPCKGYAAISHTLKYPTFCEKVKNTTLIRACKRVDWEQQKTSMIMDWADLVRPGPRRQSNPATHPPRTISSNFYTAHVDNGDDMSIERELQFLSSHVDIEVESYKNELKRSIPGDEVTRIASTVYEPRKGELCNPELEDEIPAIPEIPVGEPGEEEIIVPADFNLGPELTAAQKKDLLGFTLPTRRTFILPGSEPITDARHLLDQTNEYVVRALNSSYPASIQPTNRTHHLHGYNTRSWFLSTGTWSSHFVAST